jgi:glycosyltransferase involved in cell wall biosynthesis
MTRIGINPARGKTGDYRPARVTVAVLTYIPDLSGYFEGRLEVLKLVLASLLAYTKPEHDLLVFDNASCQAVVDYLLDMQRAGHIDYLIRAKQNIGKIDAFRIMFKAAPGEIIAYNDDDVLFYPGWLEAHLEIMDQFPLAGMVSGTPLRDASLHAFKSLDKLTSQGVPGLSVEKGRHIQDAWEIDWATSTGRDPEKHLHATQDHLDLVLRLAKPDQQGFCEAIGGANHFQFVTPKEVVLRALPPEWTGKLMGSMVELDEAVDNLGYLRLSTGKRYTRHLGNALSQEVLDDAVALGLLKKDEIIGQNTRITQPRSGKRHWLLRIPGARRILSALYNRLFTILYR